jgi:1,4-dihydroxy-6-naphthoate synthase
MDAQLTFGISPCPNDTYIFDALLHGRISFESKCVPYIADVEELNRLAQSGDLEVTKLSAAAMAEVLDRYVILDAGAAVGRGCGPLVVSLKELAPEQLAAASLAIPGVMTTANTLLSLNGGFSGPKQEMVFNEIIPAVAKGTTDLGVIIHEGRFTYAEAGLRLVLDLGEWWERTTGLPLPLGVIAARRDLGKESILKIQEAIRRSLSYVRANPYDCMEFIQMNACEMDIDVIIEHIDTFVTDFSFELGPEGKNAVQAFLRAANPKMPEVSLFADDL